MDIKCQTKKRYFFIGNISFYKMLCINFYFTKSALLR